MTYYESYMKLGTEEKAIEQAIADTKVAIFFGGNPDRIKAIEDALNRAVADMRGTEDLADEINELIGEGFCI